MIVGLIILLIVTPLQALPADLDRDGDVDFDDFFLFVDDFGKRDLSVELGSCGIEIPEPPPSEDQTSIELVEESLYVGEIAGFYGIGVAGEIINNTSVTAEDVDVRLTIRGEDGAILSVENFVNAPRYIAVLAPGDRRPFQYLSVDGVQSVDDLLALGTFEIVWGVESDRQPSNDLILLDTTVVVAKKEINGEVQNVGSETVENIKIVFATRNEERQVTVVREDNVNFGDPLEPGETGVFSVRVWGGISAAEIFYHIRWGPSFGGNNETPYGQFR